MTISEITKTSFDDRNKEIHDACIESYLSHDNRQLKIIRGRYLSLKNKYWYDSTICFECHNQIEKLNEAIKTNDLYNSLAEKRQLSSVVAMNRH